jgi:anti-sigma factor RsiW
MHHPHPSRLQELLDGVLPAGESRALRAHLEGCAACARDFAGLGAAAAAAFSAAPRARLSASFNKKVLAALRPSPWAGRCAAAAGALCAVWTAGLGCALAWYGRPSWAGVAATGEDLLSAAASLGVLAAKLPVGRAAGLLLSDAAAALPSLLAASAAAAAVIFALGRPEAARAGRTR